MISWIKSVVSGVDVILRIQTVCRVCFYVNILACYSDFFSFLFYFICIVFFSVDWNSLSTCFSVLNLISKFCAFGKHILVTVFDAVVKIVSCINNGKNMQYDVLQHSLHFYYIFFSFVSIDKRIHIIGTTYISYSGYSYLRKIVKLKFGAYTVMRVASTLISVSVVLWSCGE